MSGSSIGTIFRVTTWGESHGKALGAVVDGCPAGIDLDESYIQAQLDRRKPGFSKYSTKRRESDKVEILSGVFEGKTTGAPISLIIFNENEKSRDYASIAESYRPSHADFGLDEKYGFRDYRGGGRSSGRETAARVAAGAVAKKILSELHINVNAYVLSIGGYSANDSKIEDFLDKCIENGDSAGGVIECVVTGMPTGVGEPVFDKLDADLAKAVMSIGAVKGFEVGIGFEAARLLGSENNDGFVSGENGKISKATNNAGGITGGMSDGSDIIIRAAIKPTPSISMPQKTVNKSGENIEIAITGRHDPVIVPRAVVVVEAMMCITLVDKIFMNMTSKMKSIKTFYGREIWND